VPGTIGIQAGITNVSSVVGQLPESVLQAPRCCVRTCATAAGRRPVEQPGRRGGNGAVLKAELLPIRSDPALPVPVLVGRKRRLIRQLHLRETVMY